jgi:hypothetical protein
MRWLLFAVLVWVWPLPLFGLEGSSVPVARFAELAGALSILIAVEGAGGMVGAMLLLLWGHVLVYGLLLFGVSSLLARFGLARLPAPVATGVAFAMVGAMLLWGVFGHPYDSLFHHSEAHASLLDLYR